VQYLYPAAPDAATLQRYLAEFEKLIDTARARGTKVVVAKPPTPRRYRDRLPKEAEFDAAIRQLLGAKGVAFEDLSGALAEDRFYYDTDHLNRAGASALIDGPLSALIKRHAGR
jgi:sugar phosphate isomerase/epimerase